MQAQCPTAASNSFTIEKAICAGTVAFLNGTVPTGGVAGTYSYQWQRSSNANCTAGFTNIAGANGEDYSVPSSDAAGMCYRRVVNSGACAAINSAADKVETTDRTTPAEPTLDVTQPTCALATGTLRVTSPAPAAGISYSIDGTNYANTTGAFALLSPGTYSITVRYPSGCISPANSETINSLPVLSGTVSPAAATVCANGSVTLTVSGGVGTSYKWYRNGSLVSTTTVNSYTAAQAGTYTAEILLGICTSPASGRSLVSAGTAPSGGITPATATICPGNTQTLTATGGGTYQWYRDNNIITGATSSTYAAGQAGIYSVVINNGTCSAPAANTSTITVSNLPTGTVSPGSASICQGSSQQLAVTPTSGATYQWFRDNQAITGATSATYTATLAGTYAVDITNSNGCKNRAGNTATVSVNPLPNGSISPANISICTGDSTTLTATGGTTYQWYRGGVGLNQFSATLLVKEAGTYAVDIFDANNCRGKSANEAVVTIVSAPTGTITPGNAVVCPGGDVQLRATGGASYQWKLNGNAITGATAATYNATSAGTYTVDIFSGNCKGTATNSSTVTLGTIPSGTVSPATATLCTGNSVELRATGGTSYQWRLNGNNIAGATSATYNATQTGTYTVVVSNASCSASATGTAVITPSTAITFATGSDNPNCLATAGRITVTSPTGGSGSGYTYSKDNGASFQPASTFDNLAAGTYQIVVKDGAGCKSNAQGVVISAFTTTLRATQTNTPITCTQPTGTVTVTPTGGVAPYAYSLDGGAYQASNLFQGLTAGNHKVTVKDAPGCLVELNFNITLVNSTLAASANTTNASCGQANGSATIAATGGAAPYTYSLNNGAFGTNNNFGNLNTGIQRVTVKDGAGCLFNVSFTINQPFGLPNLVVNNPPRICRDDSANLRATAVTAGSDAGLALTYWTDAAVTTALANPVKALPGTYYIKATNNGGCVTVKPVVVTLHTPAAANVFATRFNACAGDTIPLTASTGSAYQWYRNDTLLPSAVSIAYQATLPGRYHALVNDGTCYAKSSNTLALKFDPCVPDATVVVPTAFTPNRNGANDLLRPVFYHISQLNYFRVYNRWGQQVYETRVIGRGWDGTVNGKPQPPETYSWILECIGKNGETIRQSGRSLLIR